jgi:hypothetical protein
VVVGQSHGSASVTVDLQGVPLSEALAVVSRASGCTVARYPGGTYFLGDPKPYDQATAVIRSRRLRPEQLAELVQSVGSESGRVVSLEAGVAVIADQASVLDSVCSAVARVEAVEVPVWLVEFDMLDCSARSLARAGVVGELSAKSQWSLATGAHPELVLGVMTDLAKSSDRSSSRTQQALVCRDTEQAEISSARRLYVAKQEVTEFGAVRNVGFSEIDVGLVCRASCSDLGGGRVQVDVDLTLDSLDAIEAGLPQTSGTRLRTKFEAAAGVPRLAGRLDYERRSTGLPDRWFGKAASSEDRSMFVVVRCVRLGG